MPLDKESEEEHNMLDDPNEKDIDEELSSSEHSIDNMN